MKFEWVSTLTDRSGLIIPKRATGFSAGYDIMAYESGMITIDKPYFMPTGLKVTMPHDFYMKITLRSSLVKKGIIIPNSPCIIDADYYNNPDNEGHFFIPLIALYSLFDGVTIKRGDIIAQGIFCRYYCVDGDYPGLGPERQGGIGSTNANTQTQKT